MSGELSVLVETCAEQPLQLPGSSGYGDARLVRRDLGGPRKRLSVAFNECFRDPFDQLARPLIGRPSEVKLRQVPAHPETSPR